MCIHSNIIRLATGWYCPDCKQSFDEKPEVPKITFLNVEEKPVEEKPKRTRKPKDTKAE